MTRALEDVILLDFTRDFAASVGTALLADFGATVIRVERPGRANVSAPDGWQCRVELAHRNKLSLVLDFESRQGQGILEELVMRSTAVAVDGTPADIEVRGLGDAKLRALNERLIYARMTGFGPRGPDRDLPALDELAAARSGVMPTLGQPGQPPVFPGSGQMYAAAMLAFGVLTALNHLEETGEGQVVDVSLLGGNLFGAGIDLQSYVATGSERFLSPSDLTERGNPIGSALYQTADERWVTLTMPDTARWWPRLAEAVGLDADDPRFDDHWKRCDENAPALTRELQQAFRRYPAAHWRAVFEEKQLSAEVVEEFDFPTHDEHAAANGYVCEVLDRQGRPHKTLGLPIYLSESPAELACLAPEPGQDSVRVLRELLEYPAAKIEELVGAGVIC